MKHVNRSLLVLPLIGLVLGSIAWSGVKDIPNGYMDGRKDAKYGTYNTVVQVSARVFQDRLQILDNKSYGLSLLSEEDFIKQAELVYVLENEVIHLYRDIANAPAGPAGPLTEFEKDSLMFNAVRSYKNVRHHAERLNENMIRFIDHKLPGPNGQQVRTETPSGQESLYAANYRSDKDLTDAEKQEQYKLKLDGFLKKGGSLSEIHELNSAYFRSLKEYTFLEYAWLANGKVYVTEGKAGHLLLAKGALVKSAGQIVFVKDSDRKNTLMIVTNASGNYKPDLLSAEMMAEHLQRNFNIASELTVVTKGEPLSTQAVKIYMKGLGASPTAIDQEVAALEGEAYDIQHPGIFMSAQCSSAFAD